MRFHWHCSYRNECEYKVYGFPGVGDASIDMYRVPYHGLEDYMRKTHNGDEASFQRNEMDRVGGATIHRSTYRENHYNRWPEDLYREFVAHLTQKHEEGEKHLADLKAKHPDVHFDEYPLFIPRPIYFDAVANHFRDEPWYQPQQARPAA